MPKRELPIETINVTEARQTWSSLLDRVFRAHRRVIVEKSGIPVAAIISVRDLDRLRRLERERDRDFAIVDEMRQAFEGVAVEEIEDEAARALADVRSEARQGSTAPLR